MSCIRAWRWVAAHEFRDAWQVVDGEHSGMKGVQTAIGKYGISAEKPNRQDVFFTGIRIEADPSTDMQQWLGAMKDANPNMVSYKYPAQPRNLRSLSTCARRAVQTSIPRCLLQVVSLLTRRERMA